MKQRTNEAHARAWAFSSLRHTKEARACAAGLVLALLTTGCTTRSIEITSEPAGALVWLNDQEVGRTPLDVDFKHYGEYDVRLHLEGHVPIVTHEKAVAPVRELPPFDLLTAWTPGHTQLHWHYVMEPLPELTDRKAAEGAVIERARAFREQLK